MESGYLQIIMSPTLWNSLVKQHQRENRKTLYFPLKEQTAIILLYQNYHNSLYPNKEINR